MAGPCWWDSYSAICFLDGWFLADVLWGSTQVADLLQQLLPTTNTLNDIANSTARHIIEMEGRVCCCCSLNQQFLVSFNNEF